MISVDLILLLVIVWQVIGKINILNVLNVITIVLLVANKVFVLLVLIHKEEFLMNVTVWMDILMQV